jgi:uncharacterized membrane protein
LLARNVSLAVLAFSLIGFGIAAYLTYSHYDSSALVCSVGDCGSVQKSEYAKIGPIPIAMLGMGMFIAVGATAIARLIGRGPLSFDTLTIASWAMTFAGILYFAYLTYLEIWVIEAVCQWCVASSIFTLLILIAESVLIAKLLGSTPED